MPSSHRRVDRGPADAVAQATAASLVDEEDAELLGEFVDESLDSLTRAEAALLTLEEHPDNGQAVGAVLRAFHTIKGVAACLDLDPISTLAHASESVLVEIRDGKARFGEAHAGLSLRTIDALRALVQAAAEASPGTPLGLPGDYHPLLEALRHLEAPPGEAAPPPPESGRSGVPEPIAGARPEVEAAGRGSTGGEPFVRVRTDRLDRLLDTVGELVIAQALVCSDETPQTPAADIGAKRRPRLGRIVRDLRDLSMSLRMVPLRSTFGRMSRVVRDVARKAGKTVELVTQGEETEIDRHIADMLADPLVHMMRNAVDHGIECPDERERRGKPRRGVVRLSARNAHGQVVIEVSDDGRGLDDGLILARAVERGLVAPHATLSPSETYGLIFAPGFSTVETVSDVSGRGVGMDVVRRSVERLHGRVSITSQQGEGARFAIHLPLTLSITDGILLKVGRERYLVPTACVLHSFRPSAAALSSIPGVGEVVLVRDKAVPLFRLHRLFDVTDAVEDPTAGIVVIALGSEGRPRAVLVDEIIGQRQIVTKSLGEWFGELKGIPGGGILGDGRVGLILDPASLLSIPHGSCPPCITSPPRVDGDEYHGRSSPAAACC